MGESELRHRLDIVDRDHVPAVPGGMRPGGAQHREVRAHAFDASAMAELGHALECWPRERDLAHLLARSRAAIPEGCLLPFIRADEWLRSAIELEPR
jgi:hypothetical protein